MSTTSSQGSPPRMRRERSFAHNDSTLTQSPYNKRRGEGGSYTPTLITRAPRREKTFYRASNFRDSSPGNREKSGATNRSMATDSVKTSTSSNLSGSRLSREGSFIRSSLSVTDGIPVVPLAESPRIVTTAGAFRLDYNEQNKLSFRRITKPDPPIEFVRHCHIKTTDSRFPYYDHDDLVKIRRFTAPLTPPLPLIRNRELSFVNDAIVTTSQRTKYKDTLLTPYDSKGDVHCKSYIQRPDVKRLLSETYSVKPGERDVKRKYLNQEESYYNSLY